MQPLLHLFKREEKGQTLVEMAIVLPLLILILMGIIQFGFIFNGHISMTSAAREGVRLGAVGASNSEVSSRVNEALAGTPLLKNTEVTIDPNNSREFGEPLTVEVSGEMDIIVPLLDSVIGDVHHLSSQAVMRVEFAGEGS